MDRRAFLRTAAVGIIAAPLVAEAQQPAKVFRIGILAYLPPTNQLGSRFRDAILQGLRDLGYVEGQNIVIEWRSWEGSYERLRALAAELARLKVEVIVVGPTPAAEEMKRASSTIPIVAVHGDPVGSGLVASLARPGGNVTGISVVNSELIGKQLQLLTEALSRPSRVAVLSNPNTSRRSCSGRKGYTGALLDRSRHQRPPRPRRLLLCAPVSRPSRPQPRTPHPLGRRHGSAGPSVSVL